MTGAVLTLPGRAGPPRRVTAGAEWEAAFWQRSAAGAWEAETFAFLDRHLAPGVTFLDIGAWIGPFTLHAARAGARVIALEPDPVARAALLANLAINGLAAEVIPAALHADAGGLELASVSAGFGKSKTSALTALGGQRARVGSLTAADLAARAGTGPALLKIDIEGHEFALGPAIAWLWRRLRAPLHLSLHPGLLAAATRAGAAAPDPATATAALLGAFAGAAVRLTGPAEAPAAEIAAPG